MAAPVHAGQSGAEMGSGAELERFEYTQVHMGVQARIVLYAPDSAAARAAAASAFDRIAALDEIMSDYRVDSELTRLIERAGEGPIPVSDELFDVLQLSQRIARLSDGAYDVTVGPLVQLWREARRSATLPSDSARSEASSRTGWMLLRLEARPPTAALARDGMRLDLGGIAKGYAADEALRALRAAGLSRALIEFGGDMVAGDPPPGQDGWRISVPLGASDVMLPDSAAGPSDPKTSEPADAPHHIILANKALSTSGDTQQFVDIGGKRYSHVVDPRTGVGLTSRVAVTVIAPKGVLSDALATALSVMGSDDGLRMIAQHFPEMEAYFRYPK